MEGVVSIASSVDHIEDHSFDRAVIMTLIHMLVKVSYRLRARFLAGFGGPGP
jgi:hypothetical protein